MMRVLLSLTERCIRFGCIGAKAKFETVDRTVLNHSKSVIEKMFDLKKLLCLHLFISI